MNFAISVKTHVRAPQGKEPTCVLGCFLRGSAARALGPKRSSMRTKRRGPERNTAAKFISLATQRWEAIHKVKRSSFSQPCAGHSSTGGRHHPVWDSASPVQSPSPTAQSRKREERRFLPLNKRETEAQRPAPGSLNASRAPAPKAELHPHPQCLKQSEELCSAFRRPHPPLQPQNQPSSPRLPPLPRPAHFLTLQNSA